MRNLPSNDLCNPRNREGLIFYTGEFYHEDEALHRALSREAFLAIWAPQVLPTRHRGLSLR